MKPIPRKTWIAALAAVLVIAAAAWALWPAPGPRYAGKPLRHWLVALASDDYRVRLEAEAALKNLGPEAVPELTRVVSQRDGWVNRVWRAVAGRIFPSVKKTPNADDLAREAAKLLKQLGPAAAPAAEALIYRCVPPPVSDISDLVGNIGGGRETRAALMAIGPQALPAISKVLADTNVAVIKSTLMLLASSDARDAFGANVTNLTPQLFALLKHPERSVRWWSAQPLGNIAGNDARTVPALLELMNDKETSVRRSAASVLGGLGPTAQSAVIPLRQMLSAEKPMERIAAAQALWMIAQDTNGTVQVLTDALSDQTSVPAILAVRAIARIGPAAHTAVPKLIEILQTEQTHRPSRTPSMTAITLGKIGAAAVPGLVPLLDGDNADLRMNAAAALRGIGPAAAPAVPGLIRMLRAEDLEEQMAAANALAAIGPAAKDAVPELTRLSRLETTQDVIVGHVRSAAKDALERIVPAQAAATASEPSAP